MSLKIGNTLIAGVADTSNLANKSLSNLDATGTAVLAAKAPLASPNLTGTPTAPTASAGTSTTQIATTAFVGTAITNAVGDIESAINTIRGVS